MPTAAAVLDDGATGAVQDLLEAQRRALAREIHDDIGGALGAAHFDLSWVARHPGHADAAAHVASAHAALRQAMAATQRVVHDLYPPDLSEGLAAALRALARDVGRRHGLPVALEIAPGLDAALSASTRLALYRTAQEALANVARHARAGAATVACGREGDAAWLAVRDDGRGFDLGAARTPRGAGDPRGAGGFGLRGLAERARAAGGRFAIDSRPGHGTAVRMTVPARGGPGGGEADGDGDGGHDNEDDAQGVHGRPG